MIEDMCRIAVIVGRNKTVAEAEEIRERVRPNLEKLGYELVNDLHPDHLDTRINAHLYYLANCFALMSVSDAICFTELPSDSVHTQNVEDQALLVDYAERYGLTILYATDDKQVKPGESI